MTKQEILDRAEKYFTLRDLTPKTVKSYVKMTSMFLNWCDKNSIDVNVINLEQIFDYCFFLRAEKHYAPKTYNSNMSALRFVLTHILKIPVDRTIIPNAKVPYKIPYVFSKEDISTFIGNISSLKHRSIIMLLYSCGLRVSEVCALRYEDISRKEKSVYITKSKNHMDRYVPVTDSVLNTLTSYWYQYGKPKEWLFPGQNKASHISSATINKVIKNNLIDLGWENRAVTSHTFRRTCGTHLYEEGNDIFSIQKFLGHKVPGSTAVYLRAAKLKKDFINPFDFTLKRICKGNEVNEK